MINLSLSSSPFRYLSFKIYNSVPFAFYLSYSCSIFPNNSFCSQRTLCWDRISSWNLCSTFLWSSCIILYAASNYCYFLAFRSWSSLINFSDDSYSCSFLVLVRFNLLIICYFSFKSLLYSDYKSADKAPLFTSASASFIMAFLSSSFVYVSYLFKLAISSFIMMI